MFASVVVNLLVLPPLLLLGVGLISSRWANRSVETMQQISQLLAGFLFLTALAGIGLLATSGPVDHLFGGPFRLYYDSLSAVVLLLIAFVGLIIVRYSTRYLDGEASQGRFFQWLLFTLGAVSTLVLSGNLIMFTLAWMLTSLGLHQLLTHYSERPWAVWAARKKFLISRLGDLFLLAALGLAWQTFGTLDFSGIFAQCELFRENPSSQPASIGLMAALFVLGAMTKSAQFPFHSWLPDTMETPTPVSALMHAGIINAGGFLVIRLSPLMTLSPAAMACLAAIGGFTALFAGVIMLTQATVKRALAYSTIAQMGFMMLQCGLGAFSLALLHLTAHSLYKAYAFLNSGNGVQAAAALRGPTAGMHFPGNWALALLPAGVLSAGFLLVSFQSAGIDLEHKPGGLVLGLIMWSALTTLLWPALRLAHREVAARAIVAAIGVSASYVCGFLLFDAVLANSVSYQLLHQHSFIIAMIATCCLGFITLLFLQFIVATHTRNRYLARLYVHAANGFYVDIPARALTAQVWGERSATP
ncbi:MAG: proton-conducting transporter membrane subunit [Rubinisphaera brasiliensis]|uniref:proton-conducting transporter transmembrane domain-containing protein n=1 Tax=Rubinisphaera brasiliensis TaxID=119 RepID=UPI00391B690A